MSSNTIRHIYKYENEEYREISNLLFVLMKSLREKTDIYPVAFGILGLSNSQHRDVEPDDILPYIKERIEGFDSENQSELHYKKAIELCLSYSVSQTYGDNISSKSLDELRKYFKIVSMKKWMGDTEVACWFLYSFKNTKWDDLIENAASYLKNIYLKTKFDPKNDIGYLLFGISQYEDILPLIDEEAKFGIRKWISNEQKSFDSFCLLSVALTKSRQSDFEQLCVTELQRMFHGYNMNLISENIKTIGLLLNAVYLCEIGILDDKIVERLNKATNDPLISKVVDIHTKDSTITLKFKDGKIPQSPIIKNLALYLMFLNETSLSTGYILTEDMKVEFDEFLKSFSVDRPKVISQNLFTMLLILSNISLILGILGYWYFVFPEILDTLSSISPYIPTAVDMVLRDILNWLLILAPYMLINFDYLVVKGLDITVSGILIGGYIKEIFLRIGDYIKKVLSGRKKGDAT